MATLLFFALSMYFLGTGSIFMFGTFLFLALIFAID